tara:strand:- start:4242 stop:4529 length:288 start_codon:yes stop_codon:yes gene_type:complete
MKLIKIIKSSNNKKKYDAYFLLDNGKQKKTSFGAAGSSDFLINQDEKRKKNYRSRHAKDLKTKDPTRPGFLSYYITWNKKNINDSIEDYKKRFNL